MKNIVGIGEILWDVFPQGKVLGGAPANFAFHVSQFGLNGLAVSAIGNDELGKEIQLMLGGKNLKSHLISVDFPTGTVQVSLDANGIPQYEICEDVAWDNIPYTEDLVKIARETKTVCFGSLAQRSRYSRLTINSFLDALPDDALKVFDINLRQNFYDISTIEMSLNKCNILKINDEELMTLRRLFDWPDLDDVEICKVLLVKYSLKMVVLTMGSDGSYVISNEIISFKQTPKVKVADTVGAGDSFTGTFVAGLLYGKDIQSAHDLAVRVSAFVCTQTGAMPIIPKELIAEMQNDLVEN